MNRRFRFGVQKGQFDDPTEIAAYARLVEELGYDELFSYDHVGAEDPFVPLLVAAGATDTLRVGPLVLNNELHHPVLLARTAATVDRMTGGRLVLGLGTGYARAEHDAIGVPLRRPAARVDRFAESLQVVRALLDDGTVTVAGAHHRIALDDLGVPPVQSPVPVLIGGHGRRLVGVAARYADIFQFTGLTHARDGTPQPAGFAVAEVTRRTRWLTEAAGERGEHIERSALVQFTAIGDGAPSPEDLAERFGIDADTVAETPFVLAGPASAVVDKLERLRGTLGLSHFVVRDPRGFAPVADALRDR